jgi:hypothetical protein
LFHILNFNGVLVSESFNPVAALEDRLTKLERVADDLRSQLRRGKRIGFFVLLLLTTVALMAADEPKAKTTESTGFVLKDVQGNTRLEMAIRDGAATLELLDETRVPRVLLFAAKDLSGIYLFDGNKKRRASLAMDNQGRLGLQLFDNNGVRRADLGAGRTSFGLRLFDPEEKQRVILSAAKEGGALMFGDKSGNDRATFAEIEGQPTLTLTDEKGKTLFTRP